MTQSAKHYLRSLLQLAGLLALLVAALPAGRAQAAGATSGGAVPVTLTSPDSGTVGQPLAFTVSATNTTASRADQVRITVWFLRSAQLIAPLPNPDTCGRAGGSGGSTTFACTLAALDPGASASIAFTLLPGVAGPMSVQTSISAIVNGASTSGGAVLQVPIAPAPADVQVTGSASTGSPARGATFTYTFQVKNSSAGPAVAANFSDTLPDALTLVATSATNGAPCTTSAGTVNCALGDLAGGAQVLVTLTVTAPGTAATLTNTGSAAASNGDPQPSNNSASVTVQVR